MLKIDAHQHFWKFDPVRDSWITDEMSAIRRDFLPEDLFPLLRENGIDGCIAVQSDQTEADNEFLLGLAAKKRLYQGGGRLDRSAIGKGSRAAGILSAIR